MADLALTVLIFFVVFSLFGLYFSVRPPRFTTENIPEAIGIPYDSVTLTTADGLHLKGWWIPQPNSNRVIIGLHGYPADKGDIFPALIFLARKYNLFLFDFRYFGESEGRYTTVGAREVMDLEAAVAYAQSRGIERIGAWGFSLGGAVALMGVPRIPAMRAVVAESSFADLSSMARDSYRYLWWLKYPMGELTGLWARLFLGVNPREVSPAKAIRGSRIPILLIHSRDDQTIPFAHAERLREALSDNPKAEFWFREGLGHGEMGGEYESRIYRFFDQNL